MLDFRKVIFVLKVIVLVLSLTEIFVFWKKGLNPVEEFSGINL